MEQSNEVLTVTGYGSTRDEALTLADKKAAQYFGDTPYRRSDVGQARSECELVDGTVLTWEVDVDYRPGASS